MMNKKKVLTSLVLGTAMVSQVAVPVFAANQDNNSPAKNPDAHTTIGISEVSAKDAEGLDPTLNVSFEVPLYVTTAAVGGEDALRTPTKYDISNSGKRGIVVTRVQIEKLAAWDTVTTAPAADAQNKTKVKLTIGGLDMPATAGKNVKVEADDLAKNGKESVFSKDEKYKIIPKKDETKNENGKASTSKGNTGKDYVTTEGIKLAGAIANVERTAVPAASQFKVTYTVSAITKTADENYDKVQGGNDGLAGKNEIVGFTYVGDDKAAAQLK